MNPFVEQFLIEGRELIEQGVNDLLALEANPGDAAYLDGIFRAVHTLKGAAGIIDFAAMARGLHAAEDALSAARAGTRKLTPALVGDCLSVLDQVGRWLDAIEAAGGELPDDADADADAMVARFAGDDPVADTPVAAPSAARELPLLCREILEAQCLMLDGAQPRGLPGHLASALRVVTNALRHVGLPAAADELEETLEGVATAGDPAPLIAAIQAILAGTLTTPEPETAPDPADTMRPAQETVARALRVDVERIDTLVRLAGELTVIKSAIGLLCKPPETGADPNDLVARLKAQHAQLDRLATDLRYAVLSVRVLPLREVFRRFPRVVRDLSLGLGKPIQLLTEGDDTEADKEIVENLFEPLLHVMRNAADHGLEDADRRVAAGKPVQGTIRLRAARAGEQVIVEIEDDGSGIDVSRIRTLAERRGVASAATLATMTQAEIVDLVFMPGFSTAAQVTTVSGRGVGMDAVRTAVGRLGGSVSIESRTGQGTTVRFVLPFSLLITRIITVEAGGQLFGIPLDSVIETVQIGKDRIMPIGGAHAFALRDKVVSLFDLAAIVGTGQAGFDADNVVVVIAMGGDLVGLVVERLGERIDAILKPMDGLLSGTAGIAGTTLLGDGRVLIVLDVQELLR